MSTSPYEPTATPINNQSAELRHHSQSQQRTADPDRLLTIDDVAAWLGVSKGWVYDHVKRKRPRLPCTRFGELTRFRKREIERFIEEHAAGNDGTST